MRKISLILTVLLLFASSCSQPEAVEETSPAPAEAAPAE